MAGGHPRFYDRSGYVSPEIDPSGTGVWDSEGCNDLGADFVASATDRRAQMNEQRVGVRSQATQSIDGGLDDTLRGAAPAGVRQSQAPPHRVDEEDGNAIGDSHGQQQACPAGDDGIGLAEDLHTVMKPIMDHGHRAVHLPAARDPGDARGLLQMVPTIQRRGTWCGPVGLRCPGADGGAEVQPGIAQRNPLDQSDVLASPVLLT